MLKLQEYLKIKLNTNIITINKLKYYNNYLQQSINYNLSVQSLRIKSLEHYYTNRYLLINNLVNRKNQYIYKTKNKRKNKILLYFPQYDIESNYYRILLLILKKHRNRKIKQDLIINPIALKDLNITILDTSIYNTIQDYLGHSRIIKSEKLFNSYYNNKILEKIKEEKLVMNDLNGMFGSDLFSINLKINTYMNMFLKQYITKRYKFELQINIIKVIKIFRLLKQQHIQAKNSAKNQGKNKKKGIYAKSVDATNLTKNIYNTNIKTNTIKNYKYKKDEFVENYEIFEEYNENLLHENYIYEYEILDKKNIPSINNKKNNIKKIKLLNYYERYKQVKDIINYDYDITILTKSLNYLVNISEENNYNFNDNTEYVTNNLTQYNYRNHLFNKYIILEQLFNYYRKRKNTYTDLSEYNLLKDKLYILNIKESLINIKSLQENYKMLKNIELIVENTETVKVYNEINYLDNNLRKTYNLYWSTNSIYSKFVGFLIRSGKKHKAELILNNSLETIKNIIDCNPMYLLIKAVYNGQVFFEFTKQKRQNKALLIPRYVPAGKRIIISMRAMCQQLHNNELLRKVKKSKKYKISTSYLLCNTLITYFFKVGKIKLDLINNVTNAYKQKHLLKKNINKNVYNKLLKFLAFRKISGYHTSR